MVCDLDQPVHEDLNNLGVSNGFCGFMDRAA